MDIYPLGHSSFRIKGKNVTVVIDPFDPSAVGFPFPKHTAADIVTVSHKHQDHNAISQIEGSPYIVDGPGEYEIKGVGIIGIPLFHDDKKGALRGSITAYHIEIDGINIVHLGDIGAPLTNDEIERLDGVDILFVPVGGSVTLDQNQIVSVISEIGPMIVIPMHYKTPRHDAKAFGDLAPVTTFLKSMGKEEIQPIPKLSITKDKMPTEMQIVVLE